LHHPEGRAVADVGDLIPTDHPIVETYRGGPPAVDGRCVLLWVQRGKRATANRAANLAILAADMLGLPVVAAFCLVPDYPAATLRAYTFMAEGLRELPDAFAARNVGWALRVGRPEVEIPALTAEFGAALVVTDQDTLPLGRAWRTGVAAALDVPLVAVDSDTVAPPYLFPREEHATHTLRPKLWRAIAAGGFLDPIADPAAAVVSGLSAVRTGPDPLAALETFPIDRAVGPSPTVQGGRAEAWCRFGLFLDTRVDGYAPGGRHKPEPAAQSGLSPFFHYGQVGPVEVARAAIGRWVGEAGWVGPRGFARFGPEPAAADEPLATFLDELVTQRELAVNFALRNPAFDRYEGLPEWGRATLEAHAADPRPVRYDGRTIEFGETGDRLWNAAQRQLVFEGYLPNRLRMYWAKQLLLWTVSPREAFDLALRLNDRYQLDGRDPNGYAGIAWSIGGRHDRPFPPKKPVLGLIRPMGLKGMRQKFDLDAYIARVEALTGEPVPGTEPPLPSRRQGALALG
jgi:deoxyribodipyrimidine photo-lyase